MMKKIKELFFNRTAYVVYAVCTGGGLAYGALVPPFYLHFLDGLTITGFFALALAIIRASWIAGDFTFFSWGPKRHSRRDPNAKYEGDPTRGMSYTQYRSAIREERKDLKNEYMPSSLLVLAVALVLSLLY
ncbi:MAG: hypothetical protein ACI32N_07585 [Bulleidia sp.]